MNMEEDFVSPEDLKVIESCVKIDLDKGSTSVRSRDLENRQLRTQAFYLYRLPTELILEGVKLRLEMMFRGGGFHKGLE